MNTDDQWKAFYTLLPFFTPVQSFRVFLIVFRIVCSPPPPPIKINSKINWKYSLYVVDVVKSSTKQNSCISLKSIVFCNPPHTWTIFYIYNRVFSQGDAKSFGCQCVSKTWTRISFEKIGFITHTHTHTHLRNHRVWETVWYRSYLPSWHKKNVHTYFSWQQPN